MGLCTLRFSAHEMSSTVNNDGKINPASASFISEATISKSTFVGPPNKLYLELKYKFFDILIFHNSHFIQNII